MDSKEINVRAPVKRLAGQIAGQLLSNQQAKSFCSKSKDKLINGKCACTAYRNRNCSKVPRIVRVTSKSNVNKSAFRVERKFDNSGDTKAGPSKLSNLPSKKNIMPEKQKPSQIPRRKPTFKESSNKESLTKKNCLRDARNVQRIQLLINQDFRPEERAPASSIASTRPIPTLPTLGQIYARENGIDTDILNDWFVELDTPVNSMASNFFNISSRLLDVPTTAENVLDKATTNKRATTVSNLEFDNANYPPNAYKTTDENISDWLSSDVEYPTRDNESGYRSISPPTHTPIDIKSKHSNRSLASTKVESIPEKDLQLSESSSKRSIQSSLVNKSTATTIKDQSTVVFAQKTPVSNTNVGGEGKKVTKADHSKNYQYPSRNTCASHPVQVSQPQVTVPSYVECPSEILQKTTNFEDAVPTSDTTNTLSSILGTDSEFHDDLSSQCIMEHDDSLDEHCALEWCHQCRSCVRDEKSVDSEETSVADSLICQYNDDLLHSSLMNSSDHYHQFHWKRHYNGINHCKKCQRYRRFPSTRYKLPKTLASLRKRMSLRLCRRRLNKVWKKTTERWAVWSAKSPHKFRKLGMMHYLQRSLLWEDVDVQTNAFVYRETGTEPTLKEQKSAAISAMLKFGLSSTDKNKSDTSDSASCNNASKFRQINIGPSMYPLLYNSKNKSLSQELNKEKVVLIGKENDIDNSKPIATMSLDTQSVKNSVITQTISCCHSKDKNEVKLTDRQIDTENESDNYIEICEISMDDKRTGTGNMLYLMKDDVTSTVMDLNALRHSNWETQNAHTQMQIVCNNAETDVKFIPTQDIRSTCVFTRVSENVNFLRPYGTNTDLKNLNSMNVMTSEVIKRSPTYNHIVTQVTPVQSLKKISTGILTTKSLFENKSEKISTSTGMDDIENKLKDFTNQVMPQLPSFMTSVTQSTTTPALALKEACAVTSRKEFDCTEVSTNPAQVQSGVCLTSPSLCRNPHIETSSCGTETSYSKYDTTSTDKLKIYLNTGMLINSLVEGALMRNGVKATSTDTKSIGSKYTSEIATCTNSKSKGSVIEKEKDTNPTRLPADINSYKQRSSPYQQGAEWKRTSVIGQAKTDNCTQYSCIAQNDMVSNRLERIGHSRLLSVRTLSHTADETGAQTDPVHIIDGDMYAQRQYKGTSVFTSQCALDQPLKPATNLMKDYGLKPTTTVTNELGQTNNCLSSSPTSSRRKSSSNRTSSFRLNPSATLSSDLSTNMWIKSYIEKGYQCQLEIGRKLNDGKPITYSSCGSSQDEKKTDSKSVGSETQSECQPIINNVTTVASAKTNMAMEKYKDPITDVDKQIVKMVDNVTSDEIVRKEVKEITLQANPENSDAATEYSQAFEKKSACVFTSRCILPAPSLCNCQMQNCGPLTGDCLFVYGKPRCVVHLNKESSDASVQMSFSPNHLEFCPLATQMPSVYEALCETTKRISQQESKLRELKNLCKSYGVDAEVETIGLIGASEMRSDSMMTSPNVQSASVVTSHCSRSYALQNDQHTQQAPMFSLPSWNDNSSLQSREDGGVQTSCDSQHAKLLEIPTHDDDPAEIHFNGRFSKKYTTSNLTLKGTRKDIAKVNCHDHRKEGPPECLKSDLVASCRYYSSMLTKQLARVREQLAKHLTPLETNYTCQIPNAYTEACTMKPSAREEFGCQTFKNRPYDKGSRFTTSLSPAVSLIDIRHHDKEHLKAVYFMLSAIEGRLRRFKYNIE